MTMEKADSQGMGVYSPTEGVSMFESDWRPAFLSLVQNTSAIGTAGKLRRTDTDEEFSFLKLVPMAVQAQRTYWGEGEFVRGRTPECKSADAITADMMFGDGTPTKFAGQACADCQFRSDNPFERGDKCQAGYLVAFYSLETNEAYLMRLNGSATRIARVVGNANTVRRKTINLFAQEVTTNNGRFWGLRAGGGEELNAEEIAYVEGIFQDSPLSKREGFSDEGTARAVPPAPETPKPSPVKEVNEVLFDGSTSTPEPKQAPLEQTDSEDDDKLPW